MVITPPCKGKHSIRHPHTKRRMSYMRLILHQMLTFARNNVDAIEAPKQDTLNAPLYDEAIKLHPRRNWNNLGTRCLIHRKAAPPRTIRRATVKEAVEASLYPGINHFCGTISRSNTIITTSCHICTKRRYTNPGYRVLILKKDGHSGCASNGYPTRSFTCSPGKRYTSLPGS